MAGKKKRENEEELSAGQEEPTAEQDDAVEEEENAVAEKDDAAEAKDDAALEKTSEKEAVAAGGIKQRLLNAPAAVKKSLKPSEGIRETVSLNRKLTIGIVAAVTLALLLAIGAWAYDCSQEDQIANGVRVGGVDVGGRSADEARDVIQNKVVAPLKRPVVVSLRATSASSSTPGSSTRAPTSTAWSTRRSSAPATRACRPASGAR